jgi:hypothetical protein
MILTAAVKIALLASGCFLLCGMLTGVWKYAKIMTSPEHTAPVYVDIAHRSSFFYSFASLVIAALTAFTSYSPAQQLGLVLVPIAYFGLTVAGYVREGILNRTDNMFRERNFTTTTFMYALMAGEIGALVLILGGFVYTQFFG